MSRRANRSKATRFAPRSPYAASKAAADLLALAYHATYGVPVADHARLQHLRPEPVSREDRPALRHQSDRRSARARLWRRPADPRLALRRRSRARHPARARARRAGRRLQCRRRHAANESRADPRADATAAAVRWTRTSSTSPTAPGHDRRYAVNSRRSCARWAGARTRPFDDGIARTVAWYRDNESWWRPLKAGLPIA